MGKRRGEEKRGRKKERGRIKKAGRKGEAREKRTGQEEREKEREEDDNVQRGAHMLSFSSLSSGHFRTLPKIRLPAQYFALSSL